MQLYRVAMYSAFMDRILRKYSQSLFLTIENEWCIISPNNSVFGLALCKNTNREGGFACHEIQKEAKRVSGECCIYDSCSDPCLHRDVYSLCHERILFTHRVERNCQGTGLRRTSEF